MAAAPNQNQLVRQPMFGGAMSIALPARFADVSKFRQIPDHQHVYADANTDQSFIIELLDVAEEEADKRAAVFHFNSIAHDNSAQSSELEIDPLVRELPGAGTRSIVWGKQKVAKFNEANANDVRVHVACYRLRNVSTDIVLSFNSPLLISEASSSAGAVDRAELQQLCNPETALALFQEVANSVEVHDYSLFGGNP
eukprot:m.19191 g.19191  ORF g.19191 m.19191 type:complete len:197 (+) comp10323_c0_seq1:644-1234(+)